MILASCERNRKRFTAIVVLFGLMCGLWLPSITDAEWQALAPVRKGTKWGFQDYNSKKLVIEPKFDHVCTGLVLTEGGGTLIRIGVKDKWGYIDGGGYTRIYPQFDYALEFSENLAAINVGGVVQAQAFEGNEELCTIEGGKWGYTDKSGRVVILPQFDEASAFSEGLAAVRVGDEWGYTDEAGRITIAPRFASAEQFSEGLAQVRIDGRWGFVNKEGRMAVPAQYEATWPFKEGLAAVKAGGKWGFANKAGVLLIKPQFDRAFWFSRGEAVVRNGGEKAVRIDRTGASNDSWKYFAQSTQNDFYYIDPKQTTYPSKNTSRGWIKQIGEKDGVSLALKEVDCSAKKIRSLSYVSYDEYGKVTHSGSKADDWDYVVPNTVGAAMLEELCRSSTPPTTGGKKKQKLGK